MYDLNYPEIPNSWNNEEKTKMANFNEKINSHKENDLIEEAKRNIESCMNLLDTHERQLERAMDVIKLALVDIEDQKCELGDMLDKLTQKEEQKEERR